MRSTQQDKTVQLAPVIIRILEEILRSLEGSFNWAVIAEPTATDDIDDIFGAWDEPTADEPTMAIKRARVKVDDTKGKGPAGADPTQNASPQCTRSSRGLKRKQDNEEEDDEDENKGEDEEEDEEEYDEDNKPDEKRDEGKRKAARPVKRARRVKSATEVHSEDDANKRLHPDGTCDGCAHASVPCELSSDSRTACDRCQGLKVKCSLSKNKEAKKESLRRSEPRKVAAKKTGISRKTSPTRSKPTSATHLLADTMMVFRNLHVQGTTQIPLKSVEELVPQEGEGLETVVRVMRWDFEPQMCRGRSGSVLQGNVRPGHDHEIPSKSYIS